MKLERVIPKSFLLCDSCNDNLTDTNFIAIKNCAWYEGNLLCNECEQNIKPTGLLVKRIKVDDDLSQTNLSKPARIYSVTL